MEEDILMDGPGRIAVFDAAALRQRIPSTGAQPDELTQERLRLMQNAAVDELPANPEQAKCKLRRDADEDDEEPPSPKRRKAAPKVRQPPSFSSTDH